MINQRLKGTFLNQRSHFINGRLLQVVPTVPLRIGLTNLYLNFMKIRFTRVSVACTLKSSLSFEIIYGIYVYFRFRQFLFRIINWNLKEILNIFGYMTAQKRQTTFRKRQNYEINDDPQVVFLSSSFVGHSVTIKAFLSDPKFERGMSNLRYFLNIYLITSEI